MAGMMSETKITKGSRELISYLAPRIAWELQQAWRLFGWSGCAGIICLGIACIIWWHTHSLSQQQFILAQELRQANLTANLRPIGKTENGEILDQLASFYDYLPAHDMIPDQLKSLIKVAEKNGVTISKAEYKVQPDENALFLRYQIIFPLKATYPQIQSFMVNSLHQLPTLVLESVTFKREHIESAEVEARIQYVLLVKKIEVKETIK